MDDLLGFQPTEAQKGPILGISIFKRLYTGNNLFLLNFLFLKMVVLHAFNLFVAMQFRHCMVCIYRIATNIVLYEANPQQ